MDALRLLTFVQYWAMQPLLCDEALDRCQSPHQPTLKAPRALLARRKLAQIEHTKLPWLHKHTQAETCNSHISKTVGRTKCFAYVVIYICSVSGSKARYCRSGVWVSITGLWLQVVLL